jgi:K+-sensing histidine kinase KdpD
VQHGAPGTRVTIHLEGAREHVAIAVHNRGAVISSEQLDGIFNPMKAPRSPREASARGTSGSLGLGLYLAERIVTAHDGCIVVSSSESDGTTFTVHLPRQVKSPPA